MKTQIAVVIVIILVVLGLLYFLPGPAEETPTDEEIFCTLDALMCPDGSGVGREGPGCQFRACPYTGPYIGVLQLVPGVGYQLVLGNIEGVPGEVSYTMPLDLSTTSGITELLNQNVQISGRFQTGNTLVVESLELVADPEEDTEEVIPSNG